MKKVRTNKAKRRRVALMLAVMAALGGWSANANDQRRQQLVERIPLLTWAHRISSTTDWSVPDYTWLSKNGILVFPKFRSSMTVDQALEVDARTGEKTSFDGFNRKLKELSPPLACAPALSPDRRWLFWFECGRGSPRPHSNWLAVRLDGTQAVVGKAREYDVRGGVWSQRSDEYIVLFGDKDQLEAIHYSLASPDWPHHVPLANMGDADRYSSILGLTPTGGAIIIDMSEKRTGSVNFHAADVQTGQRRTRSWNVALPLGAQAYRIPVLSPRADRLAWLFYFDKPYQARQATQARNATYEIWISLLDGSKMHLAGYQNVERDPNPFIKEFRNPAGSVKALKWLPDGTHLSFVYQDALYTISAD